ncbi:cytochrome c [Priestia megaterium]|nr:cytochrome c [Priestia megaterium]
MKKTLFALVTGTSLVLSACGGADDSAKESASSGEEIYQQNCTGCHGNNLEGARGPSLEQVGSKYSQEEIQDIVVNGQGNMPKGLVNEEEAKKVSEWLAEKK